MLSQQFPDRSVFIYVFFFLHMKRQFPAVSCPIVFHEKSSHLPARASSVISVFDDTNVFRCTDEDILVDLGDHAIHRHDDTGKKVNQPALVFAFHIFRVH